MTTMTMTTRSKTTMTTERAAWPHLQSAEDARLERTRRLAVRAQALRDPLGAKGFRITRPRVQREAAIRRLASLAAVGSFVASFALIVTQVPGPGSDTATGAQISTTTRSASTGSTGGSTIGATIAGSRSGAAILKLEPTAEPRQSHEKSRSS
jgi:hypothetical protein